MPAGIDSNWSRTSGSDDVLNKTTYGQGTSFPSTWPTTRIFWRIDTNTLWKNTGTEGTPVWTELIPSPTFNTGTSFPSTLATKGNTVLLLRTDTHTNYHLDSAERPSGNPSAYIDYLAESPYTKGTGHLIINLINPIFQDDFTLYSSDANGLLFWLTTDSSDLNVSNTNNRVDITFENGDVDKKITVDLLSTISDSAWVMRVKIILTTVTTGTGSNRFLFGISDSNSIANVSQDMLAVCIHYSSSAANWKTFDGNGVAPGTAGTLSASIRTASAETIYAQLTRLSTTSFKVELFSDASFTTSLGSAINTISSGIVNLRYIHFLNEQAGLGEALTASFSDVGLKNGVTTW